MKFKSLNVQKSGFSIKKPIDKQRKKSLVLDKSNSSEEITTDKKYQKISNSSKLDKGKL